MRCAAWNSWIHRLPILGFLVLGLVPPVQGWISDDPKVNFNTLDQGIGETDAALATAKAVLGPEFREFQSKRYIVLSNTDPSWTRAQAERLERTHHQFHAFVRRMGITVQPQRCKLVCVLFDKKSDYRDFAAREDGVTDPWISGHYSPRHDWIAFYRADDGEAAAAADEHIAEAETEIRDAKERQREALRDDRRDEAAFLDRQIQTAQKNVNEAKERLVSFRQGVATATTIHEAVHQLAFHTELQTPKVEYPLWICEGLATSFETDRDNAAFGPQVEFGVRREGFEQTLRDGVVMPLHTFISLTSLAAVDECGPKRFYDQSYAFMTWAMRYRKEQMVKLFRAYLQEPSGRPTPERHLELFHMTFGDVESVERAWLKHESSRLAAADDNR